jgi:hypothetical protein
MHLSASYSQVSPGTSTVSICSFFEYFHPFVNFLVAHIDIAILKFLVTPVYYFSPLLTTNIVSQITTLKVSKYHAYSGMNDVSLLNKRPIFSVLPISILSVNEIAFNVCFTLV